MILWLASIAAAAPLNVGLTGVESAKAVHLLFGESGDTISSCVPTTEGWACEAVDVVRSAPISVVIDTKLFPAGSVTEEGSDLTLAYSGGVLEPLWRRVVTPATGASGGLLIIRVLNADIDQAPMLRMSLGGSTAEVGCADDGSFPDNAANDGTFHCSKLLSRSELASSQWSTTLSIRDAQGEDRILGELSYPGGLGIRFATVTVGGESEASTAPFDLATTSPASDLEAELEQQAPPTEDSPEPAPPKPPEDVISGAAPPPVTPWVWVFLSFGLGLLLGRRMGTGGHPSNGQLDGVQILPVSAVGGSGPVPQGEPVVVFGREPHVSLARLMSEMTALRRLVVVGMLPDVELQQGHQIVHVTDPDRHAVRRLLQSMCSDGGVPPVLLISGLDAVMDTGGASPDPTMDLIDDVRSQVWVAWFRTESEVLPDDLAVWDHDEQAGWSVR